MIKAVISLQMTIEEVERFILKALPLDSDVSLYWKGKELWACKHTPFGVLNGPVIINWENYIVEVVDQVFTEYNSFPEYNLSDLGAEL